MAPILAGLALAAGAARRLRPISLEVPKPLCPVVDATLLDHALARLAEVDADPAVNVHHHASRIVEAVGDRAHVSHEEAEALGTAGAVGRLGPWLDGRPVVIVNADTWSPGGLPRLLAGWSGETVRVLVPGGGPFGPRALVAGSLLPGSIAASLSAEPSGLYEVVWRHAQAEGRLEVVPFEGPFHDCGTPRRLLEANLAAAGKEGFVHARAHVAGMARHSVVGPGAVVDGVVSDSLIFAGARVAAGERLERAIRLRGERRSLTILVR